MDDMFTAGMLSNCLVIWTLVCVPVTLIAIIRAYIHGARIVERELQVQQEGDMPRFQAEEPPPEFRWYRCPQCRQPRWTDNPVCPDCLVTMSITATPKEQFDLEKALVERSLQRVHALRTKADFTPLSDAEAVALFNLEDGSGDFEVRQLERLLDLRRAYRQRSEETMQARRLAFALWLVKHGKLSEEAGE